MSVPTRRPSTTPPARDVEGVDCAGERRRVAAAGTAGSLLLLFLSEDCDGCRPFWPVLGDPEALGLGQDDGVLAVTRPIPHADAAALSVLVPGDAARTLVVLSRTAWSDYRVQGPPFFVLVDHGHVVSEGVAWSVGYVAEHVRRARGRSGVRDGGSAGRPRGSGADEVGDVQGGHG